MEDDRVECPVCHRFFAVTSAGLIRLHGPVAKRCLGFHLAPSQSLTHPPPAPSSSASDQSMGLGHDRSQSPPQVNTSSSADSLIYKNIHPRVPIIKRIPRASRYLATQKFCSLLEGVVKENFLPSWERLLSFTSRSLFTPRRGGKR